MREGRIGLALRRAQELSPDRVVDALAEACEGTGASEPAVYLIDHDDRWLTPLRPERTDSVPVPVAGSAAGLAFTRRQPEESVDGGSRRLWLPLTEGSNRLGVLALSVGALDDEQRSWCAYLADVAAQLVVTRRQYTDSFVRARRRQPMSLAAELQWNLLPPLQLTAPGITLAGMVAPAYEVAGDVFDYALNDRVLHFAVVDSMGHALHSALVAALVIGGYRSCRREHVDLLTTAEILDRAVAEQFGGDRFATAQLGELDLGTGVCTWVNAGHPLPFLVRGEEVEELVCPPRLPIGLGDVDPQPPELATVQLRPGDRFICFSDGVTESRDADGEHYGAGLLHEALAGGAGQSAAGLAQRVVVESIEHQDGQQRDDATLLVIELPSGSG